MAENDYSNLVYSSENMGNWNRQQKAREDAQQTIFSGDTFKPRPRTTAQVTTLDGLALCPFCLYNSTADKFAVSTGSGFHKGLGQCPRCKNKSQWKTLKRVWTARQFAEWCYAYSCEGFWSKVSYKDFLEGLRKVHALDTFWNRYRELKGDNTDENESYPEYLDRKQREEAELSPWPET